MVQLREDKEFKFDFKTDWTWMKSEHERIEENHKKENGGYNVKLENAEGIDGDAKTSKNNRTPYYLRDFV